MSNVRALRAAIAGLIGLAAAEEQQVLMTAPAAEDGSAASWAAAAVVAHNTEFRREQVERLRSIRRDQAPPEFAEVDHRSAELYAVLSAQSAAPVAAESWTVSGQLLAELHTVSDADLLDPARNPWLRGRQLWLQVIVRGFWHPTGHLGEYYLGHERPGRAVALGQRAVDTAGYLDAPDQARGMASYNLACAQAGAGMLDQAAASAALAIRLNSDLRANAGRDPDLALLRDSGRLAGIAAG
jgi:hypothetical protein